MARERHTNYFVHTLLRARDWQHRPEFDQVCAWWRGRGVSFQLASPGRGVCALVGMGGAGKTAIADRFLNDLLDDTSTTRQRVSPPLPPPRSVFVYSFYDDDKPENFFRHLQIWLEGTSAPDKQKSPTQLMFDIQQHEGLIILDGLERVQESSARGGFGRLTSPSLRDLLNHIASGSARELSVLVTSGFPLTDLRDSQPRYFHAIPVDQIDVAAGVALLRERGVRGTDMQLAPIVEHCGRHALTVDLAGGYIKEYGHADPATPLNLGTAEELQAEVEQEPDDDKRAVLKQGIRFDRIAQRYREAMLNSDEAALALLERICLFRLGVDCETIAAIFTGSAAEKVSGKSLSSLDNDQLQRKLDWLVRMRIVEANESFAPRHLGRSDGATGRRNAKTLHFAQNGRHIVYTIHPAVRDGFLSEITREVDLASHEAIRQELARREGVGRKPRLLLKDGRLLTRDGKLLVSRPSEALPSDPPTLDLLEEIVHHTIQSGYVDEAWGIYKNRIGGFENLAWRLGAYERGLRICEAFVKGAKSLRDAGDSSPHGQLFSTAESALYLQSLGRLDEAIKCHCETLELIVPTGESRKTSVAYQNLADALIASGRVASGSGNADVAWVHALRAGSNSELYASSALQAHVFSLNGKNQDALSTFDRSLRLQHDAESGNLLPLYSRRGIRHCLLLTRLGRLRNAADLTYANLSIVAESWGEHNSDAPSCYLILAEVAILQGDLTNAYELCSKSHSWAQQRDAKKALCWAILLRSKLELLTFKDRHPTGDHHGNAVETVITEGLKIARDCGYGLYHIDLLLERARLHLLRGDAGAALGDIEVALDTGIAANEETGQVELLAANHEECGYAWAIPVGLQLRAEALLLQAAHEVISVGWALPTEERTLNSIDVAAVGSAHPTIGQLVDDAKQLLHEALDRWHDLRDPEPTEDNNFKPDGKEYNYRAAETWQVLQDLDRGTLTNYPIQNTMDPESKSIPVPIHEPATVSKRFHVALSFPGEHRAFVLEVADALAAKLNQDRVFYDEWYEAELLGVGGDLKLQSMYEQADLVVPFFSEYYDNPWCSMEWETIRGILLTRRKDDAVIPVHLDDTDVPGWSAVNFGIRLKGRSPQQIAEVILQAIAKRCSTTNKSN